MCNDCAYNQDGICYASRTWWDYITEDGSCSLFKDREEADDNADD